MVPQPTYSHSKGIRHFNTFAILGCQSLRPFPAHGQGGPALHLHASEDSYPCDSSEVLRLRGKKLLQGPPHHPVCQPPTMKSVSPRTAPLWEALASSMLCCPEKSCFQVLVVRLNTCRSPRSIFSLPLLPPGRPTPPLSTRLSPSKLQQDCCLGIGVTLVLLVGLA